MLSMMKDREFWHQIRTAHLKFRHEDDELSKDEREWVVQKFRHVETMNDLRKVCLSMFTKFKPTHGWDCNLCFGDAYADDIYRFAHDSYSLDNNGLCYDGDTRSIRYINHDSDDHVYKMKAGKFLRRLIDASPMSILPECVKVWLCEDFAERWQAYSQSKVANKELHISEEREDFERIYDRANYESDFGSCMSHDGGVQAVFYKDSVKAKAAWLENASGKIVARCVIFTDVTDEDGNKWRLAERQYSSDGDNVLKRMLVDKLIAEGEIDGYKQVGVDCHNSRAFVANDGTSLSDKLFKIDCNLEEGDYMCYMDSFKWYDYDEGIAYNFLSGNASYRLDETDMYFEGHRHQVYSEYHGEWIDEDEATYVDSRDDWFYNHDVRYCENTQEYEFCDDCVQLANGDYAYYGYEREGYEGVYYCDNCCEYYLEDDMRYSELLDEYYCCDCADELEQEYMEDHADDEDGRFRYDCVDDKWYDTKEWDDVEVLAYDHNTDTRKQVYTRARNIFMLAEYDGKYYYGNCRWAWSKEKECDVRTPIEFTEIEVVDGQVTVHVA